MTNDSHTPPKPFEWLAGGLFFGKDNSSGDGIESIDSSKDVLSLLEGINDDLEVVILTKTPKEEKEEETNKNVVVQNDSVKEDNNNKNHNNEDDDDDEASISKESKFLASRLSRLRFLLYDERRISSQQQHGNKSHTPAVAGATMQAVTGDDKLQHLIPKLIKHLISLPFESRKHVAAIFNYLLVCGLEGSDAYLYIPIMIGFRDYIEINFDEILTQIVNGHNITESSSSSAESSSSSSDVGLHCGSMYRSCFKHVALYRQLVSTTDRVERFVFPFLDTYVHLPNFDISSDAMESLRLVFTLGCDNNQQQQQQEQQQQQQQQQSSSDINNYIDSNTQIEMTELVANFLTRDYDAIWEQRFNPKLLNGGNTSQKANYMTRRIALQILSTVLLTRSNYSVMIKYVNSRNNLILIMKQLRDTSPHITFYAFHVFKVFVANPSKIPEVHKILYDNKDKLCKYLETLHQDKENSDTQFRDEKALIISTIRDLQEHQG